MTESDLVIENIDGDAAVIVTVTTLGTDGSETLAQAVREGIEVELPDDQVVER
jgi:hypothetical protein